MSRDGRYKDLISHNRPGCGVRGELSPTSHGSPLHSRNSASSVSPAAGDDRLRASAPSGMQAHEGGPGPARMKRRLLTGLLTAGVLVSAAFTAWTIPAAAQQVHVQLPTGEVVPVDVPPGTNPNDIQLPGPIVQPTTPAPEPTTPETTPKPKPAPRLRPRPRPPRRPSRRSPTPARAPAAARRRSARTRACACAATRPTASAGSADASSLNPRMSLRRTAAVAAGARRFATTTARLRGATPASSMRCRVRR